MLDIKNAFSNSSVTVAKFFQEPGLAFYIPLYQREYSWDKDNIEQLMEDISFGIEHLLQDENEIRFMGTIIRVTEANRSNISPQDDRALPTRIDNVIDGQQRISTIALLAALLYKRLSELKNRLPDSPEYVELHTEVNSKLLTLLELFSVDLRRGKPHQKPVVIRGSVDCWTLRGTEEDNYKSDVAYYLSTFLRAIDNHEDLPGLPSGHLVASNLRRMNSWLSRVEKAHLETEDNAAGDYPPAWSILEQIDETNIWSYARPDIRQSILDAQREASAIQSTLCSLVQVLAFAHYLLERCCFTVIDPSSENWAFDMFQSLNATGTPLTSIETFKPMVVNYAKQYAEGFKTPLLKLISNSLMNCSQARVVPRRKAG